MLHRAASRSSEVLRAADGEDAPVAVRTILDVLEEQARRTPAAIAIVADDRAFSYAEIDAASAAVAYSVAAQGCGAGALVGLAVPRGFAMVAGMIGIMKAGAAYLPLDPGLPDARIRQIVAEAAPVLIVAASGRTPATGVPVLPLDAIDWAAPPRRRACPDGVTGQDLAYVLYTSGSTGSPKGVEVGHAALLNLVASCRREPGMDERDVTLALARMSFDVSILEILLPLSCGARVVIVPEETTRDPRALARAIDRHRATVLQAPPTLWQALIDGGWQGSDRLRAWSGAEPLSRALADRLLPLCGALWNCYGPTETAVLSTVHRVRAGEGDVPIGRAIGNTSLSIVDADMRAVPDGQAGELCIGGIGVARGYRGRPDLTAARFVTRPGTRERVYRTGDRVRRVAGQVHYLGRIDDQIKLRGFRVEPGEIEAVLCDHPGLSACAVRVWPDAIGEPALFAYVVRREGRADGERALRRYLRERLPDYMVPQRIIVLPALPLTPNAKLDRAALPPPFAAAAEAVASAAPAGLTATEARLAAIWRSLLGPATVGRDDDFFDLGGYSLLTVQLLLAVEAQFGRALSLAELLAHSSLARMAMLIDGSGEDPMARRIVPVRASGGATPLCWLNAGPRLRPALGAIGGDTPVFGLNLAPEDEARLGAAFDIPQLAALIVGLLDEQMGDRPFHLGGWCRWGIVAFEVARQWCAAGRPPPRVVLLDADLPGRRAATLRRLRAWLAVRVRGAPALATGEGLSERVGLLSARYVAVPYGGDVALIQPSVGGDPAGAARRWAAVVRGRLTVHAVAGDHASMVHAGGGAPLGAAIGAALR